MGIRTLFSIKTPRIFSTRQEVDAVIAKALSFVGLSTVAVFVGLFAEIIGDLAGIRALYYVAALVFVIVIGLFFMLSQNRIRFLFLAAFLGLPIVATILPPGRFKVSIFDALMLLVVAVYFYRFCTQRTPLSDRFFVSWHFRFAFVGLLILVALSYFPLASLWVWFEVLGIYAFFRCCLEYLTDEKGFEKLVLGLGAVVLILVVGVLFERVTHVNLTLGGGNLNQNFQVGGELARRAAGFFQDSQRSAQFFACVAAFFFVLLIRKRFQAGVAKWTVRLIVPLCFIGIALSGSRAAMLALLVVIGVSAIFLIRSSALFKILLFCVMVMVGGGLSLIPASVWLSFIPESLVSRYESLEYAVEFRVNIWFDTWAMFADQPIWGIGPGSFREYLRTTNPSATGYYGIGGLAGIEYIPDQPESGYFKIFYEGGLIGTLCTLVLVVVSVRKAIATTRNHLVEMDRKTDVLAALLGLIVFGISFTTLFTVSDERNAAIFAFLLAVIWHNALLLSKETAASPRDRICQ